MTSGFNPLSAGAALAICASLAFVGYEIQAQKPNVTRYDFSVVLPHNAPDGDEDGAVILPSPRGHEPAAPGFRRGAPRDQDEDDDDDRVPLEAPGANDPIPM